MNSQNKITGIIEQISTETGVNKKDGKPFILKHVLIREVSGDYPQSANFDAFGDRADGLSVGDVVDCFFNLNAREYGGKYYNQIKAWRIKRVSATQGEYDAPVATTIQPENTNPPQSPEPIPASELEPKEDDLPF
jgi:hypothetical protein